MRTRTRHSDTHEPTVVGTDSPVVAEGGHFAPSELPQVPTQDQGRPPPLGRTKVPHPRVASTRASRMWVRTLPAIVVLAVILIFVFQNLQHARVHFLSFSGSLPIALALLAAAALGALAVLALGSVRILQLRKAVRSGRPSRREVSPGWQEESGSSTSGSLLSDTATAEGER